VYQFNHNAREVNIEMELNLNLYPTVDVTDYCSWLHALVDCKEQFLHHNEDPRNATCLRKYVAESWFRSKKYGIDPYAKTVGSRSLSSEIQTIIDRNNELIQLTCKLISPFKTMLQRFDYVFALTDQNGIFLYLDGEESALNYFREINVNIGSVWREDTAGTTAHALTLLYKCPILLLGPEHYCVAFHDTISASAPILDENEDLMGTLIVAKPLNNTSWDSCYEMVNYHIHTLSLVIAMARAIESQNRLNKQERYSNYIYDNLNNADNIIEGLISTIEEGCLVVDEAGRIRHINEQGTRMFKLKTNGCKERYIQDFLAPHSTLLNAFNSGKKTSYVDEHFSIGGETKTYSSRLVPMWNEDRVEGAIIRIRHQEKKTGHQSPAKFTFDDLLGNSKAFKAVKRLGQRFAKSKEPILLIGESGTGKELFAQAIHNAYCPEGPFIVVNCAGVPRELMESEFFGYEGGSFTGAHREGRPGKIELAHGGTLFLDEIGDMPLELQAVLLRALEYKQVMRIGGSSYKNVDFRLISATNKDLAKMVNQKSFREDLFFRLSVLSINIPPLRERDNDLNLLADHFIKKCCHELGLKPVKLSPAAKQKINNYAWPGNVRQLKNALHHAVILAQNGIIELEDLPDYILSDEIPQNQAIAPKQAKILPTKNEVISMDQLEKEAIQKALARAKYNVPKAASMLGVSKSTMYRKLKKYNIEY
jgi:transcriptional regulator with PAS, ATPase and Fis domain